ncbi:DUF2182 domain-containing protein [Pantoea sp. Tr-811]|uniref:copper chaperone n=1 Tax=Pantoea sp. Tr-811 TaxID=2608361 RepID=UPI00141EEA7B|nr:DUF2182 domain-containing protein [Pantoea sp. Tr-811]NIF28006.1 DUF2182 domain-containing protein [Pantoea sp. Tr-811]
MASTHRSRLFHAWLRDIGNDPLKCALWGASALAIAFMALQDNLHGDLQSFCITASASLLAEGWALLRLYYASMDLGGFIAAVGLMLIAMMSPALYRPLLGLWAQGRGPATVAFLLGYFWVWLLGCALLLMVALLLVSFSGSELAAGLLALLAGGVWQFSALRARSLDHCHLQPGAKRSGLLGPAQAGGLGVMHGLWCCATCWPLMLIAFCLPAVHVPLMLAGAVIIAHERSQHLHT